MAATSYCIVCEGSGYLSTGDQCITCSGFGRVMGATVVEGSDYDDDGPDYEEDEYDEEDEEEEDEDEDEDD